MSLLTYNGITLDLIKTNEYSKTAIMTPDGVDYLYSHVRINVNAILNPQAVAYAPGNPPTATPGEKPVDTEAAIRHWLEQPRGVLQWDAGLDGDVSLVSPGLNSQGQHYPCDANNGPRPGPLNVTRIDGGKSFLINFSVETWVVECPAGTKPKELISNRYSQAESFDETHFSTLTTTGQAFFRTDLLENVQLTADAFRAQCLPPVPPGYQRTRVNVVATPSRNALTYTVTDVEKPFDLGNTDARQNGSGVVWVDAMYGASSIASEGGITAAKSIEQVSVKVKGNKYSSNWKLTQFAIRLAQTKLPFGIANVFISQAAIQQSMTDRFVSLVVAVQVPSQGNNKFSVLASERLRIDNVFADQGGLNPLPPNGSGTRSSAAPVLMVAAFRAACTPVPPIPTTRLQPSGPPSGVSSAGNVAPAVSVNVAISDDLPDLPAMVAADASQYPYDDYRVDILFEKDYHRIAAPAAGPASSRTEFLVMAAPTTVMVADWTCSRIASKPVLPLATPTDPNLVLLKTQITGAAPGYMADGRTRTYRISGKYWFGLRTPYGANDRLPLGNLPWQSSSYADNFIETSDYQGGIIQDGTSGSTPVGPQT